MFFSYLKSGLRLLKDTSRNLFFFFTLFIIQYYKIPVCLPAPNIGPGTYQALNKYLSKKGKGWKEGIVGQREEEKDFLLYYFWLIHLQ